MASSIRDQRSGLLLIACSLLAIGLASAVVLESHREARRERSRVQGASLTRLLGSLPYEQVLPGPGDRGALQLVRRSQTNPDFAYAVVIGSQGQRLAYEIADGVVVPAAPLPDSPPSWYGERLLEQSDGAAIREFHAPLLRDGEWAGEIRIGFLEPSLALLVESAPLLAQLALAVFLLTPVAYAVLRQQQRPIATLAHRLEAIASPTVSQPVVIEAGTEMSGFIDRFDRFVDLIEQRVDQLEGHSHDAQTSVQVIGYQKARIESVLEVLPGAIVVLDERGEATFASAQLLPLLGVAPADAVGRPIAEWCPLEAIADLVAPYLGPSPRQRSGGPVEIVPPARPDECLAVSIHPLLSDAGERAGGSVLLVRNVTAERLARRAQGDFAAHVAHELKSPLQVIGMYSEAMLGVDGESEDFRRDACNAMQDEVQRVSTLISTLLTISRIQAGTLTVERQRVRVADLLRDVFGTAERGAARSGLQLRLDLPRELPVLTLDKELVRVALNNLLTNAVKYNREGGEVVLSARENGQRVEIEVRDTGLGIREEDLGAIFQKFYRSEDPEVQKRGGHGLGLALVAEVAGLHGAELRVESQVGQGSSFTLGFEAEAGTGGEDSGT